MAADLDVLAFPFHDWVKLEAEGWYRRDVQVLRELGTRPGVRLLIVNRPSSVPIVARAALRLKPWRVRSGRLVASGSGWWLRQLGPKVHTLDTFIPDVMQTARMRRGWWSRSLGEARTRDAISAAVLRLGLRNLVRWAFTPLAAPLAASLAGRAFVFDAIDDWLEHPEMSPYRTAAAKGYEVVCREADLTVTVADDLRTRFAGARSRVVWIPNGVDERFFEPAHAHPATVSLPAPRVGYVGRIERRMDIALLTEVGRRLPHISFLMVGPYERSHVVALRTLPNFTFIGHRPFAEIPAILAGLDVCLVPHIVGTFTRRMDPLKLYEYLAAGRAVVSTPIAGASAFQGLVSIAGTADQFVAAIEAALAETDPGASDRRRAAVRPFSWPARVDAMLSALDSVLKVAS